MNDIVKVVAVCTKVGVNMGFTKVEMFVDGKTYLNTFCEWRQRLWKSQKVFKYQAKVIKSFSPEPVARENVTSMIFNCGVHHSYCERHN